MEMRPMQRDFRIIASGEDSLPFDACDPFIIRSPCSHFVGTLIHSDGYIGALICKHGLVH